MEPFSKVWYDKLNICPLLSTAWVARTILRWDDGIQDHCQESMSKLECVNDAQHIVLDKVGASIVENHVGGKMFSLSTKYSSSFPELR